MREKYREHVEKGDRISRLTVELHRRRMEKQQEDSSADCAADMRGGDCPVEKPPSPKALCPGARGSIRHVCRDDISGSIPFDGFVLPVDYHLPPRFSEIHLPRGEGYL